MSQILATEHQFWLTPVTSNSAYRYIELLAFNNLQLREIQSSPCGKIANTDKASNLEVISNVLPPTTYCSHYEMKIPSTKTWFLNKWCTNYELFQISCSSNVSCSFFQNFTYSGVNYQIKKGKDSNNIPSTSKHQFLQVYPSRKFLNSDHHNIYL